MCQLYLSIMEKLHNIPILKGSEIALKGICGLSIALGKFMKLSQWELLWLGILQEQI